jgi:hypothetical protein
VAFVRHRRKIHTPTPRSPSWPARRPPFRPAAALLAVLSTSINGDHRPHPSTFHEDSRKTLAPHLGTTPGQPARRPPFRPAAALLAVASTPINGDHRPHPSTFHEDSRKTLAPHLGKRWHHPAAHHPAAEDAGTTRRRTTRRRKTLAPPGGACLDQSYLTASCPLPSPRVASSRLDFRFCEKAIS